jgi:hypothetical protein
MATLLFQKMRSANVANLLRNEDEVKEESLYQVKIMLRYKIGQKFMCFIVVLAMHLDIILEKIHFYLFKQLVAHHHMALVNYHVIFLY